METDILIVHLWNNVFMENKIYRKMKFYIKITFETLFDVLYQFSLRKHSAKAVSSGFFFFFYKNNFFFFLQK